MKYSSSSFDFISTPVRTCSQYDYFLQPPPFMHRSESCSSGDCRPNKSGRKQCSYFDEDAECTAHDILRYDENFEELVQSAPQLPIFEDEGSTNLHSFSNRCQPRDTTWKLRPRETVINDSFDAKKVSKSLDVNTTFNYRTPPKRKSSIAYFDDNDSFLKRNDGNFLPTNDLRLR